MRVSKIIFNNLNEQVEKVAKVCTDAPITGTESFADKLWGMGHYTPFEHNSFTCEMYNNKVADFISYCNANRFYQPAFRINDAGEAVGSFRAWAEHTGLHYSELIKMLKWEGFTRKTFFIETNIGISREILRHREMSFMERSTRYVKDFEFLPTLHNKIMDEQFISDARIINILAKKGLKRDTYREVLPLGTKTYMYVTGFEDQWEDFIRLRANKSAHAGIQDIAGQVKNAK